MFRSLRNILLYFPKITGPLRAHYNYYFGEVEISQIKHEINSLKIDYIFFDIGAKPRRFSYLSL